MAIISLGSIEISLKVIEISDIEKIIRFLQTPKINKQAFRVFWLILTKLL